MASNIDPSNINENYPVAGEDNDTQGFRDNFAFIKEALSTARTEVTSIQDAIPQSILDLGIADGQAGYVLKTNADGTFSFRDAFENGLVGVLNDLSDVSINAPLNDQILKFDSASGRWINTDSLINLDNLTTDDLNEGQANFYLTRERFDDYFSDSYTNITGDLLSANLTNSAEVNATRILSTASNTIQVANIEFITAFKAGDNVRIFRASPDQTFLTTTAVVQTPTKNGFTGTISDPYIFSYRVCQFSKTTGKISAASEEVSVSDIDLQGFNLTNNISLNITRSSQDNGILIYRRLTGSQSTANFGLIAVLGDKEFEGSLTFNFIDYYDFDYTDWSRKDVNRNEFISTSGVFHFPLIAPVLPVYGWVDATISSVNYELSRITLTQNFFFESNLIVSNNDTQFLQNEINSKVASNINTLILGPKTYIVSNLVIPSNFSLIGRGIKTKLKKLAWSSNTSNNIVSSSPTATQISISDIVFDGNMQNQYLLTDDTDDSINYAVNIAGSKHKFTGLIVDNVIGGGIYSEGSRELFLALSKITNGGLTDKFDYSPFVCRGSTEVTVANNFMKNFPGAVDISVSDVGVLNANTVSNCGSGILIFGSTKLITSPNLVLGPAGEYIQGPDILNSEYDSVNIAIEQDTNFLSDNYVYQESGQLFDLTANNAVLSYKVNPLSLVNNVEQLGNEILIGGNPPIGGIVGTNLTEGNFRFAIPRAAVNELKTTYGYSTLKQSDPNHVGLVYRALLTEYVPSGTVITVAGISPFILNPIVTEYQVIIQNPTNISVGTKVRFLNHGGTPNLNFIVGTVKRISSYQPNLNQYLLVIEYAEPLSVAGSGGSITVENTFILAKGRIL